jgi:hypothetical protein
VPAAFKELNHGANVMSHPHVLCLSHINY